jgi:hypothetical protein
MNEPGWLRTAIRGLLRPICILLRRLLDWLCCGEGDGMGISDDFSDLPGRGAAVRRRVAAADAYRARARDQLATGEVIDQMVAASTHALVLEDVHLAARTYRHFVMTVAPGVGRLYTNIQLGSDPLFVGPVTASVRYPLPSSLRARVRQTASAIEDRGSWLGGDVAARDGGTAFLTVKTTDSSGSSHKTFVALYGYPYLGLAASIPAEPVNDRDRAAWQHVSEVIDLWRDVMEELSGDTPLSR